MGRPESGSFRGWRAHPEPPEGESVYEKATTIGDWSLALEEAKRASALTKATSKIEADKTSLDRAKDAMAVALQQIEEAESRTA